MTIYARTEEGHAKAYSPHSGLPFKLRAILKVVDGRTSRAVFEDSLRAFGDVRGLLESLVIFGPSAEKVASTERSAGKLQPHNARQWSATCVSFAESSLPPTLAMHSWVGPATVAVPARGHLSGIRERQALALAVQMIEKFVLEHLPQDAPQILDNLSRMNSLELLAVSLGGYEQLVGHLGLVADQHVNEIQKILRDHF